MADGQGYSGNAQKSAAGAMQCSAGGCPDCVKQGLAVLLTIPTLADKKYAASVRGQIKPLLKGIADPALTASGYVMRSLREGYVMAWYEKPPKGLANENGWTVAQVHNGGYMTRTSFAALGMGTKGKSGVPTKEVPFTCSRVAGYAAALLFVIPDAGKAGKVWVAFSSHAWSPEVRANYAADKDGIRTQYMTCIDATAGTCKRSKPLTVANLDADVVDFAADFKIKYVDGNPFPLRLPESVLGPLKPLVQSIAFLRTAADQKLRPEAALDVYDAAKRAIGDHGKLTIANAMIVGLADPEGCTATAAQRRITLCNTAAEWVANFKDDKGEANGQWRLQSALTVKGLIKLLATQADDRNKTNSQFAAMQGKAVSRKEFDALMAAGKLPADATFAEDSESTYSDEIMQDVTTYDPYHGTIDIPSKQNVDETAAHIEQGVTKRLTGKAQGKDWQGFLATYQQKTKADHQMLAKVELDHKAWLQNALFKQLYTDNFSDSDPRDGVPYAACVNHCLLGGPISKAALTWWKPFLASDPHQKNNLLVRAMLGNQVSFFGWVMQSDQASTAYDEIKSLLDVVQQARKRGGDASAEQATGIAQSLLATGAALAARMDAAKELGTALRGQLKRLGLALAVKSESDLYLYKVRAPLGAANRMWHAMANATKTTATRTLEQGGRKIKSLVLGGGMALELQGSPKAADALVDVYLWSRGKLKVSIGKVDGQFKLTTADVLGEGQTPFAIGLTEETAASLAKQSMRVLRGAGSGLLSAGSGFLQVLVLGEAWQQFEHGTEADQHAAAVTLLTSGIGIGAACMEISGAFAKQFEAEALEKGLKIAAGKASALATAVVAVQSFVNAYGAYESGDDKATAAYAIQGIFFFVAAGAGFMAASSIAAGSEAAAIVFGLSWTGIGLIFVALGVIAGFVILLLKDTPLESWAAESIWGKASDKYASLPREQEALNEAIIGAEVDFSFASWGTLGSDLLANLGADRYNRYAGLAGQPAMARTLEARLRVILPKPAATHLPWLLQIHAARQGVGVVEVAHWGSVVPPSMDGDTAALGLYDANHAQDAVTGNPNATSLELSVRLDANQYRNAFATVRVADGATPAKDLLRGDGSFIIDHEHLPG